MHLQQTHSCWLVSFYTTSRPSVFYITLSFCSSPLAVIISFALLCLYVYVWSIPMLFICPSAFGQSEWNVGMCQHESDGLRCGSRHLIGLGPSAPPKGPLCLGTHLPHHLAAQRRHLWLLQAQVKTSVASVSNLSVSLHHLTPPPL